jgi:hypothetical protein
MLTRNRLLGALYGALALGLHLWGRYTSWWWYDNVAHCAAGLSLGSLVADADSPLGQDLAFVAGLTLVWEVLEFVTSTYPWDGNLPDRAAAEETLLDTLLVLLGALLGARWAKR